VTASLLLNGDENASAMSVTVGKTLAFAAGRVLGLMIGKSGRGFLMIWKVLGLGLMRLGPEERRR
jgi:hypothetical protein